MEQWQEVGTKLYLVLWYRQISFSWDVNNGLSCSLGNFFSDD